MPQPLITLEAVSVRLPARPEQEAALSDVTFTLTSGARLEVRGNNGAGKSTLLRLLAGEIQATAGRIIWHTSEGEETSPLAGRAVTALVSPAQQEMFQRQGWAITCRELILTGFDNTPLLYTSATEERTRAVTDTARRLHVEALLDMDIRHCSQGQLRIMLLARALVRGPRILLLDECTEGLDSGTRAHVLEILEEEARTRTLVMTTHRAGLLPAYITGTLCLEKGRLVPPGKKSVPAATAAPAPGAPKTAAGSTDTRHRPMAGFVDFSRSAQLAERSPVCHRITADSPEDLNKRTPLAERSPVCHSPAAECMSFSRSAQLTALSPVCPRITADSPEDLNKRTPLAEQSPANQRSTAEIPEQALILVKNATVYVSGDAAFEDVINIAAPGDSGTGHTPVLHNIRWTIRQGENWLVLGPNGAGKSVLLRLLAGDEHPAAGGRILRRLPLHGGVTTELSVIRKGIRLVSDSGQALYGYDLTGRDLVCTGFDNTTGQFREYSKEEYAAADALLCRWGLNALADRNLSTLSTGQRRLLFLARAVIGGPELLLLDEPCSGLDATARAYFLERLGKLAASGITFVLVSHHTEDRIPAINRVATLSAGRLTVTP